MTIPSVLADRYRIDELIGQGAMGNVYRSVDLVTGEGVAVKSLRPDVLERDPDLITRFAREGEALRVLNHPNIVRMIGAAEHNRTHYLIMEYVGGGTLHDLMQEQPQLSLDRALGIALELADALSRAHHLGVIHRDLKPSNVMLAEDGSVRLTDFGVAHFMDRGTFTQTGGIVGTWAYLSPEAYSAQPLDARSDIWSFGVMLFEMLTGQLPFDAASPSALVSTVLMQPVPDLYTLRPNLPDSLVDLLYRMLIKNRDERIGSVRQVGAELESIIQQLGIRLSQAAVWQAARQSGTSFGFSTPTPPSSERLSNLPVQGTPFIGREQALADLSRNLSEPTCRLITIVGTGGMGKTRLGIELAGRHIHTFEHGSYFVPLAPISSADQVLSAVAESIQYQFPREGDPRENLLAYMRAKNMLLVMDNFEHVIEGADFVGEMLASAPHIKVIATSRTRLNLHEECLYEIGGMAFPRHEDQQVFEDFEAVRLFISYARRAQPNYELDEVDKPAVVQICQLAGGMPLAIELAAAAVRALSPQEVADELERDLDFLQTSARNMPERQRSMRAVFDYSWNLLTTPEQDVLMRLSVFRGGLTRDAAQQVTGASVRVLMTLTDKSMLHRDPNGRYSIHELIRQFAEEKLCADSAHSHEAHSRHWSYYTAFVSRQEPQLKGPAIRAGLDALETEYKNIRAGWDWAVANDAFDQMRPMLWTWLTFHGLKGLFEDMELLFPHAAEIVSQRAGSENDPLLYELRVCELESITNEAEVRERCQRLFEEIRDHHLEQSLGWAYYVLVRKITVGSSHPEEFINTLIEETISIARASGDTWTIAFCLFQVGLTIRNLVSFGFSRSRAYTEEAYRLFDSIGENNLKVVCLAALGAVARFTGLYDAALSLYKKGYEGGLELGDYTTVGNMLWEQGQCHKALGDYEQAHHYFDTAIDYLRHRGHPNQLAVALYLKADLLVLEGNWDDASLYLNESICLIESVKRLELKSTCLRIRGILALEKGEMDDALHYFEEARILLHSISLYFEHLMTAYIGLVEVLSGNSARALNTLREGMRGWKERGFIPERVHMVLWYGMALKAEGRLEDAARYASFATFHSATHYHERKRAEGVLAELETSMEPESFREAYELGKSSELELLAEEILAESN